MDFPTLVSDIRALTGSAQAAAVRTADRLLTLRNWLIGAWVVEYEQHGEDRAAYGEALIERLAEELDHENVGGLSARNLKNFRQLALTWPDLDAGQTAFEVLGPIRQTSSAEFATPEIQQTPSVESPLVVRATTGFSSLADDLRRAFPDMKGFSRANLFNMRRAWLVWSDAPESVQQLVGRIPWGHHILLCTRVSDPEARAFYVYATLEHGWSRAILGLQVDARLHARQGRAIHNFERTLPPPSSDLAHHALKDPYIFDFLSGEERALEREVERSLVAHIERFLLELGAGFTFVGRQVPLEVGGDDFYIDCSAIT